MLNLLQQIVADQKGTPAWQRWALQLQFGEMAARTRRQ